MSSERHPDYRSSTILRARPRPRSDRLAQGKLADLREGLPSNLGARFRETRLRHHRHGSVAAHRAPHHDRHGLSDFARWRRADHLQAGESRLPRPALHAAQVPKHDQRCRKGRSGVLGKHQRRANYDRRTLHAPHADRRAATADQCPQRGDELRRSAAGAPAVCCHAHRENPVLCDPAQR